MQRPCHKCANTVYNTEKIDLSGKWFHKGCFKCTDESCGMTLSLKTFQFHDDKLYCNKHVPKHQAAVLADDPKIMHALHAPKKDAEGLHKNTVGTGEATSFGVNSMHMDHHLHAPKKELEGIQKFKSGLNEEDKIHYGIDALGIQAQLHAPKKSSENWGYIQKGAH